PATPPRRSPGPHRHARPTGWTGSQRKSGPDTDQYPRPATPRTPPATRQSDPDTKTPHRRRTAASSTSPPPPQANRAPGPHTHPPASPPPTPPRPPPPPEPGARPAPPTPPNPQRHPDHRLIQALPRWS